MRKILLILFGIITIGLLNFSSAVTYQFNNYYDEYIVTSSSAFELNKVFYSPPVICFNSTYGGQGGVTFEGNSYPINPYSVVCYGFQHGITYTVDVYWGEIRAKMYFDSSAIDNDFSSSCDYSGYILESEINSGYCLVNGLCPSSEICNYGDYSNLFIYSNNRYFPITGTNNIYVNLPSYLGYDYDYSNAGNDLDIDVGMVVDEDYIDGLNAVQNYKPTSEDFTELIGTLAPYSKILIFCVFLFIIWAWIKKPFKSKKI